MIKSKIVSVILVLILVLSVLGGCASSKSASSTGKLVDGIYKVEYDNFDTHGYKGQLEVTISAGKITDVKYDEVDKDGKFKSQDADYKAKMEESSKTYPEKAYGELKKQLLDKQSAAVDAVTGATASSNNFKALVEYALNDMAKDGKNTSAKIPAPKE